MFVVVIREEGGNGAPAIYRGEDVLALLSSVRRKYKARKKPAWFGRRTDEFIKRHYGKGVSAQWIAQVLTARRRQRVTKNMVISRARSLGLCAPRK
jgi:hypothetical protein